MGRACSRTLAGVQPATDLGLPLEVLFLILPLSIPPGTGVQDRGISWVLVQMCGHPVQFFQPSLASQLSSIPPLGSVIVSASALEQARGRSCCSPGCSGLSLCCRQWEQSWQGQVWWRTEDYSLSLTSEIRQTLCRLYLSGEKCRASQRSPRLGPQSGGQAVRKRLG